MTLRVAFLSLTGCRLYAIYWYTVWHTYYCLGEELVDVNSELHDIKQYLQEIEKTARDEKCFCME